MAGPRDAPHVSAFELRRRLLRPARIHEKEPVLPSDRERPLPMLVYYLEHGGIPALLWQSTYGKTPFFRVLLSLAPLSQLAFAASSLCIDRRSGRWCRIFLAAALTTLAVCIVSAAIPCEEEIAARLNISPATAREHVSDLLERLDGDNRTQAVLKASSTTRGDLSRPSPEQPAVSWWPGMRRCGDPMLSIQTLGTLQVRLDGATLPLPASRKTRALLGYLALSGAPQRRDRLCELFWEIPDDPRGALRWSLSRLRPVLNAGARIRLLADRERVQIDADAVAVDLDELRACARDDHTPPASLAQAWERAGALLMEACDLPDHADFSAWLEHQRKETARIRTRLARRLALAAEGPEEAESWAQRWLADVPFDPLAAQLAVATRRATGREHEALALAADLTHTFREAGLNPPDFEQRAPLSAVTQPGARDDAEGTTAPRQTVRFAQAGDQTALAWASVGDAGHPPLVKAANWLSHLELDWEAPIWSPLFRDLARTFRFIRYDERGCGLSNWDAPEISFETFVSDLEMVVEAAGLERFPLLGISQGASVSIEYAARHPERVSHLILFGGYAAGWRHLATPEECREREAIMVLTAAGWGRENPSYRSLFSRSFMPDASTEELSWFDEFQRRTTSPKNAVRFLEAFSRIDVRERLKEVRAPTLVLHSRGDARIPVATGRELATCIPHAEFVGLDSNNHLLLGREPASGEFLRHVRRFLA